MQQAPPKVYSYARISSTEQKKGHGLQRQRDAAEEYAEKHHMPLDETLRLEDSGRSAFYGEHRKSGVLGQFLRLVEAGGVARGSVLIVEDLDRLSRENPWDAMQQLGDLMKAGIDVLTTRDMQKYSRADDSNPAAPIIATVRMFLAHDESKKKSTRLRAVWKSKREKARNGGRKLTGMCPAWLKLSKDKRRYEVIPERAALILKVYQEKLAGKGIESIARELNESGVLWSKKGWHKSYLAYILHTPAVIGEFTPHGRINGKRQPVGEPIPDYYPAVVPKPLYYQVQQQFEQNQTTYKGGRNGKIRNLFAHLVKCSYCGAPMQFLDKRPKRGGVSRLMCDNARRGLGCSRHAIQYPEFERLMLTYCIGLRPQDLLADDSETASQVTLLHGKLAAAKAELSGIATQVENLADSIANTADKRVREVLEKRLSDALAKQPALEKESGRLKRKIDTLSRSFEATQAILDSLKGLFKFLDTETGERLISVRRKLKMELRKLIDRIDVYPVGRTRMTKEKAEESIQAILGAFPNLAGSQEIERLEAQFLDQIDNRAYRQFDVWFKGGAVRTIVPDREEPLAVDLDSETGKVINRHVRPDGVLLQEEFSEDGYRQRRFVRTEESELQETFMDREEAEQHFQRIVKKYLE